MSLKRRLKKLEGGKCHFKIVCIPDGLSAAEKDDFVQQYLHEKDLPSDTPVLCYTPDDMRV